MQYSICKKDFSSAALIKPSMDILAMLGRPKEENFPDSCFWWPLALTRFHAYKLFSVTDKIVRAEAAFLCDNIFDLWLNGHQFAFETKHLTLTDITHLICQGENNFHIRGYQSNTDESFISAISGGIRIYYENGKKEEFYLDEKARILQLVTFFDEGIEPEGFETMTSDFYGYVPKVPGVYPIHPIALRRSFYYIRPFTLKRMPKKATLYASALGCYEPYLNGERVTDNRLMPFGENYQKEYLCFDLLPLLKEGKNVLGMISGNGSYNCRSWGTLKANIPTLISMTELEYEDGDVEYIYTDKNWLCAPSPLVDNDLQYGERYDARLEIPHWCDEEYPAECFFPVLAEENKDYRELWLQSYPPIRATKIYTPEKIGQLGDNTPLYDVGECIAGRAALKFKNLRAGQKIRIRYCERMRGDGTPELAAYGSVFFKQDSEKGGKHEQFIRNMDVYTAKGNAAEEYECRFAYTGLRYIWIEGLDCEEQLDNISALEIRSDLKETGFIETDSRELMKIFNATKRSWHNNIHNGPTDCPTREKNFWNGDAQIFSHTACFLSDCSAFLSRWTDNGIKTETGPYGWEDEIYEMPYTLYRFYGDTEILRARYDEMLRHIERRQEFEGMILPENPHSPYSDWLSPSGVSPSKQFFSGCWYYHMLDRISEISEIVGKHEKAVELRTMANAAKEEFNKRHLAPDGSDYSAANQCGITLPIAFGIAPEEHRQKLAARLAKYVIEADYHVTTGFIGTRFMTEVLSDYGYADIVYKLLVQPKAPSWMDMLKNGATAISESWYGLDEPRGDVSMSHFTLGAVSGWFFEYLGGIRINDSTPGLSHVVLKPHMLKGIGRFKTCYKTELGDITTEWYFKGDEPVFNYSIPDGMTAEVILP